VSIEQETVMAGLSCGEVSLLAWEILSQCADHVVTLPDRDVPMAMKLFADGDMGGGSIEAGECAVPGALALLCCEPGSDLRRQIGIGADSRVLLLGCEGATDPVVYQQLLDSVNGV
jgi:diaminopropionate ammonia-lyase